MKKLFLLTLSCVAFASVHGQSEMSAQAATESEGMSLSGLTSYTLTGNNSLTNLLPEVFFGWKEDLHGENEDWFHSFLKVGPYGSSQIRLKDSTNFIPALMMPGQGGIVANSYFVFKSGDDGDKDHKSTANRIILSPLNIGLKFLPGYYDTSAVIIQHYLRAGIGYQFHDLANLMVQYTWGWHNSTSQSEGEFSKVFKTSANDVKYVNVTIQMKVNPGAAAPFYLYVMWRGFVNGDDYGNLPNQSILSFGLNKTLDFTTVSTFRKR